MLSKKLKDVTCEDVKNERSELYDEIYSAGETAAKEKHAEEIAGLTKQVADFEKADKARAEKDANEKLIRDSAKKLGKVDKGEELIASGVPVQEALTSLIAESSEQAADAAAAFAATAPPAAGNPTSSEMDLTEPKNQQEARDYCKKKYDCSNKEAWRHARVDFAQFFGASTNNNEDGGK